MYNVQFSKIKRAGVLAKIIKSINKKDVPMNINLIEIDILKHFYMYFYLSLVLKCFESIHTFKCWSHITGEENDAKVMGRWVACPDKEGARCFVVPSTGEVVVGEPGPEGPVGPRGKSLNIPI